MCHLALNQDCSVHSCGFGRIRVVHITTKLTYLEYFCTWRRSQPCVFSPNWTAVFKYPSLGRYKFPQTRPHLKKGLSPEEHSQQDAYGRQAYSLFVGWATEMWMTNVKASCSTLSQLVSPHLILKRLERNADGLPLLRKYVCDDYSRRSA